MLSQWLFKRVGRYRLGACQILNASHSHVTHRPRPQVRVARALVRHDAIVTLSVRREINVLSSVRNGISSERKRPEARERERACTRITHASLRCLSLSLSFSLYALLFYNADFSPDIVYGISVIFLNYYIK